MKLSLWALVGLLGLGQANAAEISLQGDYQVTLRSYSEHVQKALVEVLDQRLNQFNFAECRIDSAPAEAESSPIVLTENDFRDRLSHCQLLNRDWLPATAENVNNLNIRFANHLDWNVKWNQRADHYAEILGPAVAVW